MTMQKNMAVVRIYDGICGSICSASSLEVAVAVSTVVSVASASDVAAVAAVELSWRSSPAAGIR